MYTIKHHALNNRTYEYPPMDREAAHELLCHLECDASPRAAMFNADGGLVLWTDAWERRHCQDMRGSLFVEYMPSDWTLSDL